MPNNTTYTPAPGIGVDMACIAKVLTDTKDGCTYDDTVFLPGLTTANISNSGDIGKFHADNGLFATYSNPGEKALEFAVADIEPKTCAEMTGAEYENGLYSTNSANKAPEYAFGYRRLKSDGSYRYVWLLKGKFRIGNISNETKGASVNFQTQTVQFVAQNRIFDGRDQNRVDDNDPNLPADIDTAIIEAIWFENPNAAFIMEAI